MVNMLRQLRLGRLWRFRQQFRDILNCIGYEISDFLSIEFAGVCFVAESSRNSTSRPFRLDINPTGRTGVFRHSPLESTS
jgi:hypothetical protein